MSSKPNDATDKQCDVKSATSPALSQEANCGDQTKIGTSDTGSKFVPNVGLYDSTSAPLSDDALYAKARALETDLQGTTNFLIFHQGPDFTSVENVFRGMNTDEMQRFEKTYDALDGVDPLRTDLKKLGNDAQVATIETMMDKADGKTNYAGYLSIALETAKGNDQDNAGMLMRAIFNGMESKQIAEVQKQWESGNFGQYGATVTDAIANSNLSDADKALFANYFSKGADKRTSTDIVTAANSIVDGVGSSYNDESQALARYGDIVNGNSPQAIEARKELLANPDFVTKFKQAFGYTDHSDDYLNEGHVSLITTVDENKSLLAQLFQGSDSDKFVESDLLHASQVERDNYRAGRLVVESGAQVAPGSTEEQQANYYKQLSDMFLSKGGPAKAAIWADELENGRKTVVSSIAEQALNQSIKPASVINVLDSMTQDDWNLLRSSNGKPTAQMSLLKDAIATLSPDAQEQAFARLQSMSEAKSFAAAQKGKSTFEEVMDSNTGDKVDPSAVLNAVLNMTDADRQKYFSDKDFQAKVNAAAFPSSADLAAALPNTGAETRVYEAKLLQAESMLKQIAANGKKPQIEPVEAMAQKFIDGAVNQDNQLPILQSLIQDPSANEVMQKTLALGNNTDQKDPYSGILTDLTTALVPDNDPRGMLAQMLQDGKVSAQTQMYGDAKPLEGFSSLSGVTENPYSQNDPMYPVADNIMKQGGEADLADKAEMYLLGQGTDAIGYKKDVDYRYLLSRLDGMTDQQRSDFYSKFQSKYNADFVASFASHVQQTEHLSDQYANVFQHAAQQNFALTLADRVELAVVDGKGGYQAFASELAVLNSKQRDQLKSEFAGKNYGDFDSSFLGMIGKKNADLEKYTKLITTAGADPVSDFLNHVVDAKDDLSGADVDGTREGVLRALASNQEIVAQYNANRAKLPKAMLDAIDADYEAAVSNHDTSTDNVTAKVNATIDAIEVTAALATIVATFGTDSPAAAAFIIGASTDTAALSAASRAALNEAIKSQGNLTQQEKNDLIFQSTAEAGLFVGPGMAASILRAAKPGTLKALSALSDAFPKSAPVVDAAAGTLSDAEKANLALQVSEPEYIGSSVDDVFSKPAVAADGTGVEAGQTQRDAVALAKDADNLVETAPTPAATRSPQAFDPADVELEGTAAPEPNAAVQRSPQAFKPEEAQLNPAATEDTAPLKSAETKVLPSTADQAAAINDANILKAVIPPAVITDKAIEIGNQQTDFTPPPLLPNSELVKLATVKRGEGPWQSAERILAADGKKHGIDEVRALTKAIQAVYATDNGSSDMKGLKVKYTFVTQNNFANLLSSCNNDKVKALLTSMATTAAS